MKIALYIILLLMFTTAFVVKEIKLKQIAFEHTPEEHEGPEERGERTEQKEINVE